MWLILLPMLAQVPVDRAVLESEHAREAGVTALRAAAAGKDPRAQRLAARAIGRIENTAHKDAVVPLLTSPDPLVRRAAFGALAQMRATHDYGPLLVAEKDGSVRAVIFEAVGRQRPVGSDARDCWRAV